MIPTAFEYHRPDSLHDAVSLLNEHGDNAKILAGAHSLLPAMKLRLAQPKVIIDLGRLAELNFIQEREGRIVIGAMVTHHEIETSSLVRLKCPLLHAVAPQIGDPQIRNRGTLGGSLAHADPAGDWPAAILALDAEIQTLGPEGPRTIPARKFFVDLFQTALHPNEIISEILVPCTSNSVAYVKSAQRASGFAIAGVAVVIDPIQKKVQVGITGVAAKPYRAASVESTLDGQTLTPELIVAAAHKATYRRDVLGDLHASADFRRHLAQVNTRRALEMAAARADSTLLSS